MAASLIVEHWITDAAKFDQYRVAVGPMIALRQSAVDVAKDMIITLEGA